jgi:hypothetical protein
MERRDSSIRTRASNSERPGADLVSIVALRVSSVVPMRSLSLLNF